jgi:hypothetical protein
VQRFGKKLYVKLVSRWMFILYPKNCDPHQCDERYRGKILPHPRMLGLSDAERVALLPPDSFCSYVGYCDGNSQKPESCDFDHFSFPDHVRVYSTLALAA